MMYKLLFLQIKDLLSDREVIGRAKMGMPYKFFLDLNPEDEVPSYSLLSIFRNTKIKDESILEEMLNETRRNSYFERRNRIHQSISRGYKEEKIFLLNCTNHKGGGYAVTSSFVMTNITVILLFNYKY